jgi:hypothetical protein
MTPVRFTPEELRYLGDQPLGRLATVDEQHVRGVEIRGPERPGGTSTPPRPGMSRELITSHPERIRSWGLSGS